MAPDLNSVPASPRPAPRTTSRRTSQQMAPPAIPPTSPSLNILPSNQNAVNHTSLASPTAPPAPATASPTPGDNTGVGAGPGPLRHPRPLTAADLHLQLEKEQEAVVSGMLPALYSCVTKTRSIVSPVNCQYSEQLITPLLYQTLPRHPLVSQIPQITLQIICFPAHLTPCPPIANIIIAHPQTPAYAPSQQEVSTPPVEYQAV